MDRIATISSAQKISTQFLNNIGVYGRQSLDRVSEQAIGRGLYWADFTINRVNSVQVTLGTGSFWSGGKAHPFRLEQTFDFTTDLPQAAGDRRIVSIIVSASQDPAGTGPREFLKDPTVDLINTESRSTSTTHERFAGANAYFSDPSPAPTAPAAPGGQLVVGWVTLSTAGVEDETFITLNTAARLPSNESNAAQLAALKSRQDAFAGRVETIETDLASAVGQIDALPSAVTFRQLFGDMAEVKDVVDVPQNAVSYRVENFVDDTGSKTDHVDYNARLDDGLTFPHVANATGALSLFAANDPLMKTVDGVTLPAWNDALRIDVVGRSGSVSFSDKQSHSISFRRLRRGRIRWRFGRCYRWINRRLLYARQSRRDYHMLWAKPGEDAVYIAAYEIDDVRGFERRLIPYNARRRRWWKDWARLFYHPWHYVTTSVAGRYIAQTFLSSSTAYLTKIDLFFDKKGAGDVTIQICETINGEPNIDAVIATTTLASADINLWPQATPVALTPTLLEAGVRYAAVMSTDGAHALATVSGNRYLQGSLQTATDGVWNDLNLGLDLSIRMYFAKFDAARTVVQLAPLSLTGGILGVDVNNAGLEPEGTQLSLEYQKNGSGAWFPIDNTASVDPLESLPTLLNMRAVYSGTTDLMPAIDFTDSDYEVWRPDTSYTWIGRQDDGGQVDFGQTVTTVVVEVSVANYDAAHHTVTASLIEVDGGVGTEAHDGVSSDIDPDDPLRRVVTFTFTGVSLNTCYLKVEGATTDAVDIYVVEKVFAFGSA
ncbi:MAG: hypothetical protein ROR55_20000 [Devosia sp.]